MDTRRTILEVNGKPFIAIAGESHNSSASDPDFMTAVWEKGRQLGLNTLLLPVSWEMVEQEEGIFDFSVADALIGQAREYGMKIIFLWFGTWKNAQSTYVPQWVKRDLVRFPRAQMEKGKNKLRLPSFYNIAYSTLSYLGEETCRADAKAFSAFMAHLKQVDGEEKTVIGVQVENETGVQGSDREHSDLADALFAGEVPQGLLQYLYSHTAHMDERMRNALDHGKPEGSWQEIFGDMAGEAFSAWHIASYVEKVAKAGREKYDLPMMVNCWLEQGEPGHYPSGGPVAKVMEIWKYAAPSIDVICPDIYLRNFLEICDSYVRPDNPLFIPETATHSHAAPRLVYSIGHHHASCFAPFGFEDMGEPFSTAAGFLFGMDTSDPLLQTPQNIQDYRWCAETLASMMDLLTARYGTNDLQAVISEEVDMSPVDLSLGMETLLQLPVQVMEYGDFAFRVCMNHPLVNRRDGVCMILRESEDTFYILANGCFLEPVSTDPEKPELDLLLFQEGRFENGSWIPGRWLNGDESFQLSYNQFTLLKMKLFSYA